MTLLKTPGGFATALLCLTLLAASGCERDAKRSAREVEAVRTQLASATPPAFVGTSALDKQLWAQTKAFYELRQNTPAWINAGTPLPSVQKLTAVLLASADEGLNPQEYGAAGIIAKADALKSAKDAKAAIDFELYLTHTLLRYSSHVALGHPIARDIDPNWTVAPREIDLAAVVHEHISNDKLQNLTGKLAPQHPEYARLREMLQRYREIAAAGKMQILPTDFKLKVGDPSPHLVALRSNLLILGDLQEQPRGDDNVFDEDLSKAEENFEERNATQPEKKPDAAKIAVIDTYDQNLGDAVRRFEARHGLNPDGVPDPLMIAAMNVPPLARAHQLALNLERWRWMPADFGTPHIFVNVASYRLQVRDDEENVPLKMRVIAGEPAHPTPIFSDVMTTVVFSPYWNIPESIEVKEMYPLIAKDSGYLAKKGIEVVRYADGKAVVIDPSSIDWKNPKDAPDFQLRQKSGASNSLGFVKFLFPNRHNVYLHDTPTDNLFDRLTRDLSHGCVRLEEPKALAAYLLRDQSEWTEQRIEAAMHAGKEEQVTLKTPIAVHLVYLTARVDEDGVPQFFDDPYAHDPRQTELLKPL